MSLREQVLSEDARMGTDAEWARRQLLERARHLPPGERALVQMVISGRSSRREMAAALAIPPGTVSRRVRRLLARLHHPIVVALTEQSGRLRAEYRQLGIEHFLHGRSARELADYHQMTHSKAKQMIEWIRGWAAGVGR